MGRKQMLTNKVNMKNNIQAIVLAAAVTSLVGWATQGPTGGSFNAVQLSTAMYGKKADTFVVVQDTSSSMNEPHTHDTRYVAHRDAGQSKLELAKETLSHMNQTIPQLDFNVGMVAFGTGCVNKAEVLYGLETYDRNGLGGGLTKLTCAIGTTPMGAGIDTANSKLLAGLGLGQIAMFIVSDGISDESHTSDGGVGKEGALAAAKKVKDQLGDRVCIYPIQVGNDPGGEEFMNKLAAIGGCGFAINAMDIFSPKTVAGYVIKTLLKPAENTTAPAVISPVKITFSADALFDFDKAVLKSEGKQSLDNLMDKLGNVKYDVIVAVGYTDRIGKEDYNKKLSLRRAEAVKSYLVATKGVNASDVFVDGKGEANPVTGTTCIGKGISTKKLISCLQPDRRVEIEIAGIRE
ncbi:MAG: VWA domain-containing protein [Nitrosomonadales bacterium]|nr:MAG: VWA domain-containing protein [Nitrosomonadales bacterium]